MPRREGRDILARHVRPTHPNAPLRQRRDLPHAPPGALGARRRQGAPAHPAQPRAAFRHRAGALAVAVRPRRRGAVRPGGAAGGLPAGGGARGAADRGATDRARGGAGGRRGGARHSGGGRGFAGAGAPARRRRGAGRPVGARAGGAAGAAARVGDRPRAARGGAGLHRRAHGVPRLGAGDDALAARAQRPGRVAGCRLRDHGGDAAVPRVGRADGASRGDRVALVRPGDGAVRSAPDGDAVRPDEHFLRRRGQGPAAGAARALEGEARRLSAVDAGAGARRRRLRAPLAGVRRQRRGGRRRWRGCWRR